MEKFETQNSEIREAEPLKNVNIQIETDDFDPMSSGIESVKSNQPRLLRKWLDWLKSTWKERSKGYLPEASFTIYFGSHVTAEHAEDFKDLFEKCDIFVPEIMIFCNLFC